MSCRSILSKTVKENTHVQSSQLTRWEYGLGCGYNRDNGFRGDSTTLQLFFPLYPLLKLNVAQQNGAPEEVLQFLEKEYSFELLLWLSKNCSQGTLCFLWLVILPPRKSDKTQPKIKWEKRNKEMEKHRKKLPQNKRERINIDKSIQYNQKLLC